MIIWVYKICTKWLWPFQTIWLFGHLAYVYWMCKALKKNFHFDKLCCSGEYHSDAPKKKKIMIQIEYLSWKVSSGEYVLINYYFIDKKREIISRWSEN